MSDMTDLERRLANAREPFDGRPCAGARGGTDPLLARLMTEHQEHASPPVMIVRVADAEGRLKFAACIDHDGNRIRIKEFATGRERWIDRREIVEAE